MAGQTQDVEVEGHRLRLSNLGKALYPDGFTKAQVIDYYIRAAPAMLRHIGDRPLTLKRYPNGTAAGHFFEKNCPSHRPPWVRTVEVGGRGGTIRYCSADDLPTMVWLANLAAIELHPLLARNADVEAPTIMVFDLDPGPPADIVACCQVAVLLRSHLSTDGLQAFPKTSGSKGLQLYVPLNTPHTYDQTKPYAHELARRMERQYPDLVVEKMDKSIRASKVLIDWSQNHPTKTTVAAYSLRAMPSPTVSTPVTWEEVEAVVRSGDAPSLQFEAPAVLERLDRLGDLFEPVATLRQQLP